MLVQVEGGSEFRDLGGNKLNLIVVNGYLVLTDNGKCSISDF